MVQATKERMSSACYDLGKRRVFKANAQRTVKVYGTALKSLWVFGIVLRF